MKFKKEDVSIHRSADNSDPGFALKGFKLRWLSGAVESRRAGRIWTPLKVSMLPDETVKTLKDTQPTWFSTGDTIRRRDLTLSCAPIAAVEKRRREMKDNQNANEAVFRKNTQVSGNSAVRTDSETGVAMERIEPSREFA